VRVVVIGDLMLDVLVEPAGPLRVGDDTPGRIRVECGGQAANVAAWVAALGGQARLVCAQGSDDNGARAASRLGRGASRSSDRASRTAAESSSRSSIRAGSAAWSQTREVPGG
jgi:sugar/nucleoside kinase (ribokinase family)